MSSSLNQSTNVAEATYECNFLAHVPIYSYLIIRSTLQQFANNEGFTAAIYDNDRIMGIVGLNRIDRDNRIGYIGYW